jgi:hypothetical protein
MESICNFDDTLPLLPDVQRAYLEHAGDGMSADTATWLRDRGIDPAPINNAALIQYAFIWNPHAGRYDFRVYDAEHIGPKRRPVLAVPIIEDGKFIDLLLICDFIGFDTDEPDDRYFETVCCRASWLGTITPTTRLHAHPLDWLESGCTGACHIALISRAALKDLRNVESIVCNDVATALNAWSWAFDADEAELSRFVIDDTLESIDSYYREEFRWRCSGIEAEARR